MRSSGVVGVRARAATRHCSRARFSARSSHQIMRGRSSTNRTTRALFVRCLSAQRRCFVLLLAAPRLGQRQRICSEGRHGHPVPPKSSSPSGPSVLAAICGRDRAIPGVAASAINVKPLLLRHRWDGRFIIMSWEKAELRELKCIGSGHARPHCVTWQNPMIRIALS